MSDRGRSAGAFKARRSPRNRASSVNYVRGTWTNGRRAPRRLGAARSTAATGGIARFPFTGDSFAWVVPRGPEPRCRPALRRRGVRDDHQHLLVTTATSGPPDGLQRTWSSPGRHTVEFRAVGTSGHPRVDLDAFVLPQPGQPASLRRRREPPRHPRRCRRRTPVPTPTPDATPDPGPSEVLVGAGDIASCGLTGGHRDGQPDQGNPRNGLHGR